MKRIYLDNNATTQLDDQILNVLVRELKEHFGNPSSVHKEGRASRNQMIEARNLVASYFHVKTSEIMFTSSGTEALNTIIRGFCEDKAPGHIITSSVEHSAVYTTLQAMKSKGWDVTFLSPGKYGAITADAVQSALRSDTSLIVLMAVNNEIGVKTDFHAVATIAEKRRIPFFVDAVALLGKESFTIPTGVSAICFSGHKIHAPKGVGCAVVRNHLKLQPLITGGDQEYGHRGGTEDMPAIVAFAEAIRLLSIELPQASEKMRFLRDRFEEGLFSRLSGLYVNGEGPRIANTSNLYFENLDGESLLQTLDLEGISASLGSACSAGALEPSRVLLNMGFPMERASSSLRFSLSRFTTEEEIDASIEIITRVVTQLRG